MTVENKSAKVISFINMKGGVGKTTLCVTTAKQFAAQGKKVLLIDIDPQFNCTQNFYTTEEEIQQYYEEVKECRTIRRIFKTETNVTDEIEEATPDMVIKDYKGIFDIILGDINIVYENHSDADQTFRLCNFFNSFKLKRKYDYILIDCPPTISLYTNAALYASDYYIIPSKLDRYSSLGTANLMNVVKSRIRKIKQSGISNISLEPLGIIYTDIPKKLSEEQQALKAEMENLPELKDMYFFENNFISSKNLQYGQENRLTKANSKRICAEIELRIQEEYKNENK